MSRKAHRQLNSYKKHKVEFKPFIICFIVDRYGKDEEFAFCMCFDEPLEDTQHFDSVLEICQKQLEGYALDWYNDETPDIVEQFVFTKDMLQMVIDFPEFTYESRSFLNPDQSFKEIGVCWQKVSCGCVSMLKPGGN